MVAKIGIEKGVAKVWAKSGGYDGDGGDRTHEIDLTSLTNAAGTNKGRQGAKADMATIATSHLPRRWAVTLRVEFVAAVQDNGYVDLYWAPSLSSVAGTANPGGCSGVDGDYEGTAAGTYLEGLLQLQHIGRLHTQNDAEPVKQQQSFTAKFTTMLPLRYGMPVVINMASQTFEDDAQEMSVTFTPLEDEKQ